MNLPGGVVEIVGLPATYVPGQTYPVECGSGVTRRSPPWAQVGLSELTAFRTSDGHGTGAFVVTASDLQTKTGLRGPFTSRFCRAPFRGNAHRTLGPVTWDFQWQAPAAAEGNVLFCVAGNAADGLGTPDNDNIYTSTVLVRDGVTPITSTTWGALKQRFR